MTSRERAETTLQLAATEATRDGSPPQAGIWLCSTRGHRSNVWLGRADHGALYLQFWREILAAALDAHAAEAVAKERQRIGEIVKLAVETSIRHEREACAHVAELWIDEGGRYRPYAKSNAFAIAAAIRARGKGAS